MSARNVRVRFSDESLQDVESILLMSERRWGTRQAARYRAAMTEVFNRLLNHPRLGQPRDDIFPGCRTLQVEQHLIFYHLPDPGTVEVVRILHQRQDPGGKVTLPDN